MITNEREYRIARADLRRFEEELGKPRAVKEQPGVHPALVAATPAILMQQLEELRAQIREYEELKSGVHRSWEFSELRSLPQVLIESRIARGLTQRELAEELKVREQAIQRYEDNRYAGASFERICDVADALGVYLQVAASLDPQVSTVAPPAAYLGASLLGTFTPTIPAYSLTGREITAVSMADVGSLGILYQDLGNSITSTVFANWSGPAHAYPFARGYRRSVGLEPIVAPTEVPRSQGTPWWYGTNQKLSDLEPVEAIAQ